MLTNPDLVKIYPRPFLPHSFLGSVLGTHSGNLYLRLQELRQQTHSQVLETVEQIDRLAPPLTPQSTNPLRETYLHEKGTLSEYLKRQYQGPSEACLQTLFFAYGLRQGIVNTAVHLSAGAALRSRDKEPIGIFHAGVFRDRNLPTKIESPGELSVRHQAWVKNLVRHQREICGPATAVFLFGSRISSCWNSAEETFHRGEKLHRIHYENGLVISSAMLAFAWFSQFALSHAQPEVLVENETSHLSP